MTASRSEYRVICKVRIRPNVICVIFEKSAFCPIGVIGGGSIPLTVVGSMALLLILLRYISIRLVPLANENSNKEVSMVKTLTARARVFFSSTFETMWAIGVGGVAGLHLLATMYSLERAPTLQ